MMGKTHMAMGIAASLLVTQPQTLSGCLLSLVGGAIGGVLADIDTLDHDSYDATKVQLFAAAFSALLLLTDYLFHLGFCDSIFQNGMLLPVAGMIGFAVLWIIGVCTAHRTFTHSLTALLVYSAAVYLISAPLAFAFTAGYASHLLLDLLNKKKLPLLYPLKFGICFKLCYANKTANRAFFRLGVIASVTYLCYFALRLLFALV